MSTDSTEQGPSPFSRPGFIVAALVVALVVVLGIVLAIVNAGRSPDPATATTPEATPPPTSSPSSGEVESVCGLRGEELDGTVTTPPAADWQYVGTVAYPTSSAVGPGATDQAAGFGYCFQRTPEGALFAAAHALALGFAPENRAWLEYVVAPGPFRDELLTEGTTSSSEGTRARIGGFRVLSYDGSTARIDLAGEGSTPAGSMTFSVVYELTWHDGDWKVRADTATPFDFSSIPNLAGYVMWGP